MKRPLHFIRIALAVLLFSTGLSAQPVISSFSPASGPIGTNVTITGSNFSATPANNIVYFGAVKATVSAAGTNSLTVQVPLGASFKPLTVTVNNRTAWSAKPFVVTFSGGNLYDSAFGLRIDSLGLNDLGNGTALADFDGDGKPDIALTAGNTSAISIFRNTTDAGMFSLSSKISIPAGNNPLGIATGDFDGDGKLDLITANYNDSSLSILRNTSLPGTISFATRDTIRTGNFPHHFCVGDIDKDGRPDIVFADNKQISSGVWGISVLRNTSTGGLISFAARKDFAIYNGFIAGDIVIGDLDGDGKADVATTTSNSIGYFYPLGIFINTSLPDTISFASRVDNSTDGLSYNLAIGDMNADGTPDLVSANYTTKDLSILRNTSSPGFLSFAFRQDQTVSGAPYTLVLTDLDGDGKPDITEGQGLATKCISVYKNNSSAGGSVSLAIRATLDTLDAFNSQPKGMLSADLDGDGLPELVCVSTNKLVILKNRSTWPVINSFTPSTGVAGTTVTISGANFTNINSVSFGGTAAASFTVLSATSISAVLGAGGTGVVAVGNTLNQTGTLRGFTYSPPLITSFSPASGPVGTTVTINGQRFDPNPANNIVYFGAVRANVSAATSTTLTVEVPAGAGFRPISVTCNNLVAFSAKPFIVSFAGGGNGFTSKSFAAKVDFPTLISPFNTFIEDLDGDGRADVLTANSTSISLLRNTGSPGNVSFAASVDITGPSNVFLPKHIYSCDLDGDGKPDIIAPGEGSASIWLYRNKSVPGNLSFASSLIKFPISTYYPAGISITDFDRDGRPDLVVSTTGNTNVYMVLRNTSVPGSISFSDDYERSTLPYNDAVTAADFDNDGLTDMALTNRQASSISTFKYNAVVPGSSINFSTRTDYASGTNPYDITAADLDGDGKPDLATADNSQGAVSTWLNNSPGGTISFAAKTDFSAGSGPIKIQAADLDGDGRPDLAVPNYSVDSISLLRNTSSTGAISFDNKFSYKTGAAPRSLAIGDLDGDGKPDLVTGNLGGTGISVFRNRIGEPDTSDICPGGNSSILAESTGSTYQWQLDSGSGFADISDNANFSGTGSNTLQLINLPAAWYGYRFRCLVNGLPGTVSTLRFRNQWLGTFNNAWENPANWSCGSVPDANTDVLISSGNVLVNVNTTIRSLKLLPGASLTLGTGVALTILH